MKDKVVYFLGAGFSAGVTNSEGIRIPSQEKLVEQIITHQNSFKSEYEKFKCFLEKTMDIPENYHVNIPLEDIFTPLDKCMSDGIAFRNISSDEAKQIRELVDYLIGKTLDILLTGNVDKKYIDKFAKFLVEKSSIRANHQYSNYDPVSVISTNWDILLDNSIHSELKRFYVNNDISKKGVVDYCCNISSYRPKDNTVKAGLEILGKGGFNVKLLKLHGSLNWLQCPKCNRLYVDFDNKIAVRQYSEPIDFKEKCRHCETNYGHSNSHALVSNLIMPTFIKNLSNAQYKLVWHNAALELSEASKVVFIGYSLPSADFEIRQLLARMVRPNASIEVVDKGDSLDDRKIIDLKSKYETFFGRHIRIFHEGSEPYVFNNLK